LLFYLNHLFLNVYFDIEQIMEETFCTGCGTTWVIWIIDFAAPGVSFEQNLIL
jgi:hypothetical protein